MTVMDPPIGGDHPACDAGAGQVSQVECLRAASFAREWR